MQPGWLANIYNRARRRWTAIAVKTEDEMQVIPAEVNHALRRLTATPVLSLAAVLTLALGIGSAVVMADVVDRLLLRAPAHVADPDRVARLYVGRGDRSFIGIIDYATFESLAAAHEELEGSAAYFSEQLTMGRGPEARRLEVVAHSQGYFDVLGVKPLLGSWTQAPNEARDDRAVISYGLWRDQFGGAADVLGRPLRLGTTTYTIAAVAPRGFSGLGITPVDAWLPLEPRARWDYGADWKNNAMFLEAMVRLRAGTLRARAEERVTAAYRASHPQASPSTVVVLGDVRQAKAPGAPAGVRVEVLVAGMSVLLLLVTCGNAANLLLVRGLRRIQEFRIKTALGASRRRLLREILIEAALLAAGAGVAALGVASAGGVTMRRLFLPPLAALASPLDARVMVLTAAFATAAALALGLGPALHLTNRRMLNPGRASATGPSRLLDWFSGLQVALSLPLLIAAALFVVSLRHARYQDFGMQTSGVAVVTTNLFELGRPMENHAVQRRIQERLRGLPGVESTALVVNLPMQAITSFMLQVPGREGASGPYTSDSLPGFNSVDPSFFKLTRMRPIDGRFFADEENRQGAPPVAVVTEAMARNFWPGERAVGRCFYMGGPAGPCTEVVGVAADARLFPSIRPTTQWASAVYLPIEQHSVNSSRALLVRTTGDPSDLLATLRREAQAASPDSPYVDVYRFDDIFDVMLRPWRLGSTVFVMFGALAVLVAAVGQATTVAYAVTRRIREIGIRSSLGAQPRHLVVLILRRSVLVVLAGLAAGLALAVSGGRVLSAQLFGIGATDPLVLIWTTLATLTVGTVAAWLAARRAARIDPVAALRAD